MDTSPRGGVEHLPVYLSRPAVCSMKGPRNHVQKSVLDKLSGIILNIEAAHSVTVGHRNPIMNSIYSVYHDEYDRLRWISFVCSRGP